ncbi:MAG: divergent polysaccharide deacetylase family protein, partial [Thermoanaerobaculia bacterium]
ASPAPRAARPPRPPLSVRRAPRLGAPSRPPRIAILIDDLGNDLAAVRRIATWPYPVAGAVLPDLPGSASAARALSGSGKEVLLHLPMEPEGYPAVRPGPGVVLRSQNEREIARILERDLESVPGAAGINNHMGSAATADPRVMRAVAGVLARRGLFLVDSRTTDSTVARDAAHNARVPSVSRRVFLDAVATPEAVGLAFEELVRRARQEGEALAIGHPHPATLGVLERELPRLKERGVRLVRVGELVK